MSKELNMTPTRLKLLLFLSGRREYSVSALAEVIAPRKGRLKWRPQAATRWGIGYIAPLEKAGLVGVEHLRMGKFVYGGGMVYITDKGWQVLREHVDA